MSPCSSLITTIFSYLALSSARVHQATNNGLHDATDYNCQNEINYISPMQIQGNPQPALRLISSPHIKSKPSWYNATQLSDGDGCEWYSCLPCVWCTCCFATADVALCCPVPAGNCCDGHLTCCIPGFDCCDDQIHCCPAGQECKKDDQGAFAGCGDN